MCFLTRLWSYANSRAVLWNCRLTESCECFIVVVSIGRRLLAKLFLVLWSAVYWWWHYSLPIVGMDRSIRTMPAYVNEWGRSRICSIILIAAGLHCFCCILYFLLVLPQSAPGTPQFMSGGATISHRWITLNFTAGPSLGASSIQIIFYDEAGTMYTAGFASNINDAVIVFTVNSDSWPNTALLPNAVYQFVVQSCNEGGCLDSPSSSMRVPGESSSW